MEGVLFPNNPQAEAPFNATTLDAGTVIGDILVMTSPTTIGNGSALGTSRTIIHQNHLSSLVGPAFAFEYFSLASLNQPFSDFNPTNYGAFEIASAHGGLSITGLSDTDKAGLFLFGAVGSITATSPALTIAGYKSDGAGGIAQLGASEIVYEVNNAGTMPLTDFYGNGDIYMIRGFLGVGVKAVRKLDVRGEPNTNGDGTVSSVGTAITGIGTSFLTSFSIGDYIIANSVQTRVLTITDNTHLTVDAAPAIPWVNLAYTIVYPISRYLDSGNTLHTALYPTGDLQLTSIVTQGDRPSIMSLGVGNLPKLSFGFSDNNHQFRTAGGANLDVIFDVLNGSTHFFGINGIFKTAYGATIGDTTFATAAPANGLYVFGVTQLNNSLGIGALPNAVTALDITSTTKGLRIPRMTTAQRTAITTTNLPGILVYDTDIDGVFATNNAGNWLQL